MPKTLGDWRSHFALIYEQPNRINIGGLDQRLLFVDYMINELYNTAVKKTAPQEKVLVARALARVFSWTFSLINYFPVEIEQAMCIKYPQVCGYCGKLPCEPSCTTAKRNEHKEGAINAEQLSWTLSEWQQHLYSMYGKKNRERGLENCVNRLHRERSEVVELYLVIKDAGTSTPEIIIKYGKELADMIAWILGIAAILDINLEKHVEEMYLKGCPACWKPEFKVLVDCRCPRFTFTGKGVERLSADTVAAGS